MVVLSNIESIGSIGNIQSAAAADCAQLEYGQYLAATSDFPWIHCAKPPHSG